MIGGGPPGSLAAASVLRVYLIPPSSLSRTHDNHDTAKANE